jgi:hypothetical protein
LGTACASRSERHDDKRRQNCNDPLHDVRLELKSPAAPRRINGRLLGRGCGVKSAAARQRPARPLLVVTLGSMG